jgi:hypothetical protein
MDRFLTATEARQQLLRLLDEVQGESASLSLAEESLPL